MKVDYEKLREIIACIIIEQGTCERSGHAWVEEKLKDLEKAINAKSTSTNKKERNNRHVKN